MQDVWDDVQHRWLLTREPGLATKNKQKGNITYCYFMYVCVYVRITISR